MFGSFTYAFVVALASAAATAVFVSASADASPQQPHNHVHARHAHACAHAYSGHNMAKRNGWDYAPFSAGWGYAPYGVGVGAGAGAGWFAPGFFAANFVNDFDRNAYAANFVDNTLFVNNQAANVASDNVHSFNSANVVG
ncbi:hypothetical protein GGI07_004674 [Coemansia sp. Benny D115]|nr:hypothetical protein GGI07_004674 [Coemansia sp. Benny D115]